MKQKLNLFIITLILVLPVTLYALLKAPQNNPAHAAVKSTPTVIEFSSPLCSECQKLKKILDIVEPKYEGQITFVKINANTANKKANEQIIKYSVRVVPTTIFTDKKGKIIAKREGSMTQETLEEQLNELLK